MTTRTRHIREFVETLSGPIVFVLFFGITYFVSATGCMLHADPTPVLVVSQGAIGVAIFALMVLALLLITLAGVAAARRLSAGSSDQEDRFLAYVTLTLAILSGIAVLWAATPAAVLPLCS
jgi:hypothetical protein